MMDGLRKFSDIVVYNLLFVICSVPVITAGASLLALCEGMQKLSADKNADFPVAATFFWTFRRNFKRATVLWIWTVVGFLFLYLLQYATLSVSGGSQGTMYMASFVVVVLLLVFGYQHLFPVAARWQELSAIEVIVRSYLVAGASLFWTIMGICATSLISGITLSLNPFVVPLGLMFWIFCGFGVTTYVCNGCFQKAAEKFERKMGE